MKHADILNYEGKYQADDQGNIYSLSYYGNKDKKHELKQHITKGYACVCFHYNGEFKNKYVHRLIWEAFNGPIPEGMQVNHKNEIKTDNRLCNLEICTSKYNNNYGTKIERQIKSQLNREVDSKPILQYDKKGVFLKEFPSIAEAARICGKNQESAECTISRCCQGKLETSLGYVWKYKAAQN